MVKRWSTIHSTAVLQGGSKRKKAEKHLLDLGMGKEEPDLCL